jgi:PKD repeat protein
LASRWQISTISGVYSSPVFDSDVDYINLTSITIPSGILGYNTTYYWHVRYWDNYGNPSTSYSAEFNFTTATSGPPNTPSNISPLNGTTDISLTPTLQSSAFVTSHAGDPAASQWQITTVSGSYTPPAKIFDSVVYTTNLTQIKIPSGFLSVHTTYYWHVRHQDSYGNWSGWSAETYFSTTAMQVPVTPSNVSPANGVTGISVTPTLTSSVFSDPDVGDSHTASRWQIREDAAPSDYSVTVYDSGTDTTNKTAITVPSIEKLSYDTTYYWHVEYQDSYGNWSDWSTETSFTTVVSGNPSTPINISPVNGATDAALTPTLQSSSFVSPDGGATHSASQWRITTISEDYTVPAKVYDSEVNTSNLTQIAVPAGLLEFGTTYYWIVRYQDSYGNWSGWSGETSFTTIVVQPPQPPINSSPADGATSVSLTPTLTSSAFSDPDAGDSHAASQWQVREATAPIDYSVTAYDSQKDTTNKTNILIPSGKLSYNTTYYWHVKYQDSYGKWSDWSTETSFTTAASGAPSTPRNLSPANDTTGIILAPTLRASDFSDIDPGDTHFASRWQIRTDSETYDSPMFDSGVDTSNLTQLAIPSGYLEYDTTYYWRVRYQDSYGNWSGWSTETFFTTAIPRPPNQPTASSPSHGAAGISLTPTLRSSVFSARDEGDSHKASQWQIRTESGTYDSPVFDSGIDTANLNKITIPAGKLDYGITYYWRVRHQDRYDNWSAYSSENLFTTVIPPPNQPTDSSPSNGATGISLTPSLQSSAFVSPDTKATHAASQWQITTASGDYSSPVYDSGADTTNNTSITIPTGILSYDTTYYWHVRYQDSYDNWSDYSSEASFATVRSIKADFSAAPIQATPGQIVTFTDTSTGDATSWVWDFGDGTTPEEWITRPEDGKVTHLYSSVGSYTVSLKVAGPAGEDTKTKVVLVQAPAPAPSHGKGLPWVPIVIGVVVVLAGAGLLWYVRRR